MEYKPTETELLDMGFEFQDQGCYYEKSLDKFSDDFVVIRFHYHWFLSFQGQNRMIYNPTKKDIKRFITLFTHK